jgi:ABC-type uncharacterized transport system substrate-binding protein
MNGISPPGNSVLQALAPTAFAVWAVLLIAGSVQADSGDQRVCVYVSSYHQGLEWSDRIEEGLRNGLEEQCRLVQYDMNSKRNLSDESKVQAAVEALSIIRAEDADIVLTSDDEAARYLIAPHLAGTRTPVVFTGIDWTVEEFGLPVENVTGMVEIAPLRPLIEQAVESVPEADRAAYVGANTPTNIQNVERYESVAKEHGIELVALLSSSFDTWKQDFLIAQEFDFVILGESSDIEDWDMSAATTHAREFTRTFSVTNHERVMPLSALGYTTLPEEQGAWAAESAIAILTGSTPSSIPIVTNQQWDTWINDTLLDASGIILPGQVSEDARHL